MGILGDILKIPLEIVKIPVKIAEEVIDAVLGEEDDQ